MKETKLKIIFTIIAALLCVLCACTAAAPDPATDAPAAGTWTETAAVTAGTVTETAYESETEDTEMKLKENITFKASKEIIIRPFSWAPRVYGTNDGELIAGSEPRTVYTPSSKGSKAAAPGVAFLPDGRLAISFQTDEDATVKGDNHSVMKIMFSDGTDARKLNKTHFSPPENIFGTPDGESSVWTGIFYGDGVICASAGTKNGSSLKIANVFCDNG